MHFTAYASLKNLLLRNSLIGETEMPERPFGGGCGIPSESVYTLPLLAKWAGKQRSVGSPPPM